MTYYQVYKQWNKRWFPWVTVTPTMIAIFETEEEAIRYIVAQNTAYEYYIETREY